MNAFYSILDKHKISERDCLQRGTLTTLQINMGNLCNQSCAHCHVEASPNGKNIMSKKVIDDIITFLSRYPLSTLDITGGAPELNPHFEYLIKAVRSENLVKDLIVRSNLTILFEAGHEHLAEFYHQHQVHLIASLPCYLQENVDRQRGAGVFARSIDALKKLNALGYARKAPFMLDLVYNPVGAHLPPKQDDLQKQYKEQLLTEYGIEFNRLITITNVPIKRFKSHLQEKGEYDRYCQLLQDNFNQDVLQNIMCRSFLSVGFDGKLYDCDFNQALGWYLKGPSGQALTLDKIQPQDLLGRDIMLGEHCLSCTAGSGSSCQGALVENTPLKKKEPGQQTVDDVHDTVKDYYGKKLQQTSDLKTNACCSVEGVPLAHREILNNIHPEILSRFYGCGSPIPDCLEGCTVLDLGCGTGRDVYVASKLTGPTGKVIGVDMTDEQLAVAQKYQEHQRRQFGHKKSNVVFKKGLIEDLTTAGIQDQSIDVVISNCVVNLTKDKRAVLKEVYRVLKEGGELYFSDVYSDRRVPDAIREDPVFYGECLGGAMYSEDFRRMMADIGFVDYRVVKQSRITLQNKEMEAKAGLVKFFSMTIRAFKIKTLEDRCEDYGQVAYYRGSIAHHPHEFRLDADHIFRTDKAVLVCGNTAALLSETRFRPHFRVEGNRSKHYGLFPCSDAAPKVKDPTDRGLSGCC